MAKSKLKINAKGNGSYYCDHLNDTVYFETTIGVRIYGPPSGTNIEVNTSDCMGYRESLHGNTEYTFQYGIKKRETPLSIKELVLDLLNF